MSAEFPTDVERTLCFGTCGGYVRQHAPHADIGCSWFEDVLRDLAPLIRAREAAAWDAGYMRGRFPFAHEGQDDPIPPGVGPAKFGSNANPYRQEADDDRD